MTESVACCPVVELRHYTLHPGRRDVLIDLFDREFVESQEDLGIRVVGQFRDLDDPDRYVWLRGFPDMDRRHAALAGFYGGPVWAAHRDAANATMIDSDDVLLLKPASPDSGFPAASAPRPPIGSAQRPPSVITATVHPLAEPVGAAVLDFFAANVEPLLALAGGARLATLRTEHARNTFRALPVREGEHVLVRFARFDDVDAHAAHLRRLARSPEWAEVERAWRSHLVGPPQVLRLQPTARSLLR